MGTVKEFVTTARVAVKAGMAGKPMPDGKYEVLTGEKHTVVVDGVKYHRIRALRRFERPFGLPPVEPGDLEDLLIFASAQVSVLREQMADISDLGYYSEHVASEAGRKVLSEVTERYAPYRKKKNWGERRESKGLILKQNPHVS